MAAKVIVCIIFYMEIWLLNMVIPGTVYVIMMPKDTPESRMHGIVHHLKTGFQPPNPLPIYCITTPSILTKNIPPPPPP